jgi:glycosyltransferase involved in cell wall biosynthesis
VELNSNIKSTKILIIPEYANFGGTLSFLRRLLFFHKKHHIQTGIVIEEKQNFPEIIQEFECLNLKINVIPNRPYIFRKPYFSIIYDIFYCWKPIQSFNPDLVVISTGTPSLMLGVFAFLKSTLFIVHSYPETKFHWGMRLFLFLFNRSNQSFATVSKFAAIKIHKCLDIPIERIHVIYNSYPSNKILDSTQMQEKIVLTIGHVSAYKNPICWLDVAQNVIEKIPEVKFIWLGDGELRDDVINRVQQLGLNTQILFPGYCEDVANYYQRSVVYFQPSLIESHGIAVVEAMANGLPCVTSNVGGLPESVIHNENGYLCSPEDANCFSTYLLKLLGNPELRAQMGIAGKQRAQTLFSEEVQESHLLNLYQSLMN